METVLAAERDVIGSAFLNPDLIRALAEEVSPEDFYAPLHEHVWRCIMRRWTAQEPVTEVLVAQEVSEGMSTATARARGVDVVTLFDMRSSVGGVASYVSAPAIQHARLVHDAARRRALEAFAVRLRQAAGTDLPLADLMSLARNEFESLKRQASVDMPTLTLGALLEGVDDYDWLIPGLLEREDRLMLTGSEGGGKTTFFRQVTILAASGINPMTFEKIEPVRVQVIDCENTERQWRRKVRPLALKAVSAGEVNPLETMHLSFPGRIDISSEKWLGAVHRLLDENKPDLLAIGPLYKMARSAMNTDDDVAPVLAALDSIRERGVALLIEAHAGHSLSGEGGQRNLRPRGSSALLGWPEMGFGLRLDKDDPNVTIIERWRGDRDERSWPESIRRGGEWPWTPMRSMQTAANEIGEALAEQAGH
jgi:replicative DNA helicase